MATDVHQVRCFVAVAEESHFGRAAERLHLTPSPVSRAVKDLERELGAELFIRRYHQVELTPAGEQVLTRARALLADFDELRNVARAVARRAPRVIHIGGTHLAPPALFDKVVDLAEELAGARPVDIHVASSAELLPEVESGKMLPACLECAEKHMDADPKQEMALREQQLSELEALGILEYARGYVDIMNAMQQVRRSQS